MAAIDVAIVALNTMMSSSIAPRIGPLEHRVLRALDRHRRPVWRVAADGAPEGLTAPQRHQALHRLVKAGLLERIERGVYLVPPRSGRILVPSIEVVGAWFAGEPHAVVGHAAAEYHRLTLDTPRIIEVQIARPKRGPVEIQGVRYVFSLAARDRVTSDDVTAASRQIRTAIASPGKLLVLLLSQTPSRRSLRPTRDARLALEVLERGAARGLWLRVEWAGLIRRHGTVAAARRLGYLLERAGLPGADALLPLRGESGNLPFSVVHPPDGPVNTRWRLLLNDPLVR